MAGIAGAHRRRLAAFARQVGGGAGLVAGGALATGVRADQREARMIEARRLLPRLRLAVALGARTAEAPLVHVLVAGRAALLQAEEAAAGRRRRVVRARVALAARQLRVHADEPEHDVRVVVLRRVDDASARPRMRRDQRDVAAVVLAVAAFAVRQLLGRQAAVQALARGSLRADRRVAADAAVGVDASADAMAGFAVGAAGELGDRGMRRMQRPGAGAAIADVAPRQPQHGDERGQRQEPARELHRGALSASNTPKSTAPYRTATTTWTTVSRSRSNANHRCSQRQVDNNPRTSS